LTKPSIKPRLREAWRRLRGGEVTPWRAGVSVAVGLAVGVTPLWGLHWLILLAICLPLRLDAPVAYVASNISLPFIAPALTFAEVQIGGWVLTGHALGLDVERVRVEGVAGFARELALGVAVTAIVLGIVGGALAYALTTWRVAKKRASAAR
jgi:uncharacterized protein (DUF2062 family)